MLVNCIHLHYSTTGTSFIAKYECTAGTLALQMARQIEVHGSSIRFPLLNRFESI